MTHQNCQEETTNSGNPLKGGSQPQGANFWTENFWWTGRESQPTETIDDAEACADFWSCQGYFIHRHHNEPRVQLYVPKAETVPIPLKYIDVTKFTHTDLDVLQEKRINDFWNVDSGKHLSNSWTGFTQFIPLKEKPLNGYMWSGERLTKIQTTTRPDHVCPKMWTKMGKAAQSREKWPKEKPKLDNARRRTGIYFIDLDERNIQKFSINARRKLERPWPLPCHAKGWFILVSRKWCKAMARKSA